MDNLEETSVTQEIGNEFIVDFSDIVGGGEFGTVYRGFKISSPEEKVAIKLFKKQNNKEKMQIIEKVTQKELSIYEQLQGDSEFLVRYYKTIVEKEEVYLVMELCDKSLEDIYFRDKRHNSDQNLGPLPNQQESFRYFLQILLGLNELYTQNIIHRDLKFANVLLKQGKVKIGDFGLGKVFQHADTDLTQTIVGTAYYTAPEILVGKYLGPNEDNQYGSNVDIWSLGIMFYYMLYGTFPQNRLPPPELGVPTIEDFTEHELNLLYPKDNKVNPEFVSILKQILVRDRLKRCKIHQLMGHQFVKEGLNWFFPKIDITELNHASKATRQIRRQLSGKFSKGLLKFQEFLNSQRKFINQTGIEVKLLSKLQLKNGKTEIFFASTCLYLILLQGHFYQKITLHQDYVPACENKNQIGGHKRTEFYRNQLNEFDKLDLEVKSNYSKLEANLKKPEIMGKLQKEYIQLWQQLEKFSNNNNSENIQKIELAYDKLVKEFIKDITTKILSDPQLQKVAEVQRTFIKLHHLQPGKIKFEDANTHPQTILNQVTNSELRQRSFDDLLKKQAIQS